MPEEKINVFAYSGFRGEEIPKTFILDEKRIKIVEIQDRWVEEGLGDRATKQFFEVKGSDGANHEIFYDEKTTEWFYRSKG
jgi:hypothetical protein